MADAKRSGKPSLPERRQIQRAQSNQQNKLREIEKQKRDIYHQAMGAYYAKNYSDAKVRFVQLEGSARYGVTARKYIDKIDQLILHKKNAEQWLCKAKETCVLTPH